MLMATPQYNGALANKMGLGFVTGFHCTVLWPLTHGITVYAQTKHDNRNSGPTTAPTRVPPKGVVCRDRHPEVERERSADQGDTPEGR